MVVLEGFGGARRVPWSPKGLVEPEGFGGARRVWWGSKGLVGPEGFGGVRRVLWGGFQRVEFARVSSRLLRHSACFRAYFLTAHLLQRMVFYVCSFTSHIESECTSVPHNRRSFRCEPQHSRLVVCRSHAHQEANVCMPSRTLSRTYNKQSHAPQFTKLNVSMQTGTSL